MVIDPSGKGKSVSTLKGNVKVWVENNYSTSLTVPDGYKGLIIASGNVELEGDMTGLLLTFGKVTFKNGGTITADKVMLDGILSKAKSIKTEAGNHCLADLFKLKIVSNSSSGTVTTSTKKKTLSAYDDMVVSLDGMFSHSNWKKVQDS